MAEPDLQKRLEALGKRLVEDVERWEQSTREQRRETLSNLTEVIGHHLARAVEKERAREERKRLSKREERRQRQREAASGLVGVVQLLVAVAFVAFAVLRPELWWLLFVALGLSLGGARQLTLVSERRRLERSAPPASVIPSRQPAPGHEVDHLCDQLLEDLAQAPEPVRRFVQAPEQTVAALRATALALDRRRQQLLAERPAARLADLEQQRAALETRRRDATDDVTRRRLGEALASLEAQQEALRQLKVAAERVDGEYTSLLVSLQELRTRVAVARSAGTEVQLEGLRGSVQRLNGELEAIGEALTQVASADLAPVAPVTSDERASSAPATRERA